MDENIKTVRREKWRKVVMLQKASGLTITEWCERNGIRARQFHYWQKILRDNALLEMSADHSSSEPMLPACGSVQEVAVQTFAEVPISSHPLPQAGMERVLPENCISDSGVMIRYQDIQVHISDNFSERALAKVLQVIRNA